VQETVRAGESKGVEGEGGVGSGQGEGTGREGGKE